MLIEKGKDGEKPAGRGNAARRPERNRMALIEAALDSIAIHGIAETTVSTIIGRAGLSRGMVHLHFRGKDNLLAAAAEAFSMEYYREMDRQIADRTEDPAALIRAVIKADLSEALLNERSARIWHAFRGAAPANAGIARFSSTRDKRLRSMIRGAFQRLAERDRTENGAALARDATYGTLALLEGMWTDFLTHEDDFDRADAARIVNRFVAALFPDHF